MCYYTGGSAECPGNTGKHRHHTCGVSKDFEKELAKQKRRKCRSGPDCEWPAVPLRDCGYEESGDNCKRLGEILCITSF